MDLHRESVYVSIGLWLCLEIDNCIRQQDSPIDSSSTVDTCYTSVFLIHTDDKVVKRPTIITVIHDFWTENVAQLYKVAAMEFPMIHPLSITVKANADVVYAASSLVSVSAAKANYTSTLYYGIQIIRTEKQCNAISTLFVFHYGDSPNRGIS